MTTLRDDHGLPLISVGRRSRAHHLVCRIVGGWHEVHVMLPEDLFGMYVVGHVECSRCGAKLAVGMTEAEQIRRLVELIDAHRPQPHPVDGFVPGDHRQHKRWPDAVRTR